MMKWAVVGIAVILIALGVLQNPAPMGFETRPASEIPSYFFAVFALALILDIAVIALALLNRRLVVTVAFIAAVFNIIPSLADQAHMLHSDPTPGAMLALEALNVVFSILLVATAWSSSRAKAAIQTS